MGFESTSSFEAPAPVSDQMSMVSVQQLADRNFGQIVEQQQKSSKVDWLPDVLFVDEKGNKNNPPTKGESKPGDERDIPVNQIGAKPNKPNLVDAPAPPDMRDVTCPIDPTERTATTDRPVQGDGTTTPEAALRDRVNDQYSTPEMEGRRQRFLSDINRFNERARTSGLSTTEVSDTFEQVSRILSAPDSAHLNVETRLALASQVMHNAAVPFEIRQNMNTCNVTSLEVGTYSRQPSAAARLVADVATTGSFTGHDGTRVTLDSESLTPSVLGTINLNDESNNRSFASQIFQVTAANIANVRESDRGNFLYVQRQPQFNKDTGEALINTDTGEVVANEPGAAGYVNGLIGASESITGGTNDSRFFLMNREQFARRSANANFFDNMDQLGERLDQMSRDGQLPATIAVHADNNLFPRRNNAIPDDLFADGHYITITGYDPRTRTVRYDDQYEAAADHNSQGVPLETLYEATHVVRANEWLNRLESSRNSIPQDQFAQDLENITTTYSSRWSVSANQNAGHSAEVEADRVSATARIRSLAQSLPQADRDRILSALNAPVAVAGK